MAADSWPGAGRRLSFGNRKSPIENCEIQCLALTLTCAIILRHSLVVARKFKIQAGPVSKRKLPRPACTLTRGRAMISAYMRKKRESPQMPEWATQITSLRERLDINQAELARRIRCSAMTISRWERGLLQPSAEHFIQLGNLGSKSEAWFFWEMAGIEPAKMANALGSASRGKKSADAPQRKDNAANHPASTRNSAHAVALPLLNGVIGTHGVAGDKRSFRTMSVSDELSVPAKWCPNPDYTSLVRVKGHSMEPAIRHGDLIAVDSFQTERTELYGNTVVVSSPSQGLAVGYLNRFDNLDVLQAEKRESKAVILNKAGDWRIVGKVLWSISMVN